MTISFCITSFDKDCRLISNLLDMLAFQTVPPDEIIIYVSGVSGLNLPTQLIIANKLVPIYTIYSFKRTIQAIARNICSKIASRDILIFFDVDDEPHPQKIEITKSIFNQHTTDFVLHNYISSHIRNSPTFSSIDPQLISLRDDLTQDTTNTNLICGGMPIHHAHIAVKKTVFQTISFNENFFYYRKEDGKFCQDLLTHNYKGVYCSEVLVRYIV